MHVDGLQLLVDGFLLRSMSHLQGVDEQPLGVVLLLQGRDLLSAPASRRCSWYLFCGGTDAMQYAVGDQPLEQMGALELGDRSLLGRALAMPERAIVLGRLVKHRVAEEE